MKETDITKERDFNHVTIRGYWDPNGSGVHEWFFNLNISEEDWKDYRFSDLLDIFERSEPFEAMTYTRDFLASMAETGFAFQSITRGTGEYFCTDGIYRTGEYIEFAGLTYSEELVSRISLFDTDLDID